MLIDRNDQIAFCYDKTKIFKTTNAFDLLTYLHNAYLLSCN